MAYTKSPSLSTYSSERIQLVRDINTRSGGNPEKDEDYLNCFIEVEKNRSVGDSRQFVVKRAGSTQLKASVGDLSARGSIYWSDQNLFIYAVGTDIYVYNVLTATTTTLASAFGTSAGVVGFTEYLYDNGTAVVVATDGTTLITIDSSGTKTVCTDPDLPAHLPYPVFLDGYLFVAKTNSADVYNSDLNNPLAWTAGNFVSAEMEPDLVIRICKINNYLAVFGRESIEYFWDSGNASGSPLLRNDSPVKNVAYLAGFAQYGNQLFYIGRSASGQPDIFMMQDFKIENIGTPSISRYLNVQGTAFTGWYGALLSCQGHNFYLINVGIYTYVYDIESKLWHRWAFQNRTNFPIVTSAGNVSTTTFYSLFMLADYSAVYQLKENLYQDAEVNFTVRIVTEASDFGTMNRKTMSRLSFIGDRPPSSSSIYVSWSDDDYKTFNTERAVEMDQDLPSIYNLGSFRQRIFRIRHSDNAPLRLQEMEADINKGAK